MLIKRSLFAVDFKSATKFIDTTANDNHCLSNVADGFLILKQRTLPNQSRPLSRLFCPRTRQFTFARYFYTPKPILRF